jgi:ankyrin repeat protein
MPPSKKKRGKAAGQQAPALGHLVKAAAEGDAVEVTRLLAAGADPNALVRGRNASGEVVQFTALCQAAALGRLEAVEVARLLLEGGADPSLASSIGVTPLIQAAGNGQLEVLRLLLERGAAVDATEPATGSTAFHAACINGQVECAESLARAGCDVGIKDSDGQTGREVAEGRGYAAVVARLRAVVGEQLRAAQAAGAVPAPEPAAVAGDEADMQLVMAAYEGDEAAVSLLLAAGADPNASAPAQLPSGEVYQTTALREAATHGRLEVARLLLDGGADPDRANSKGGTPLMAAVIEGHLEILGLLLGRGGTVDAAHPGTGFTAFQCACAHNQADCAEALVLAGCDVRLKNFKGRTGLDMAELQGHAEAVVRLRVVVADQLRAAQAAGPAPAPTLTAVVGDGGPALQLVTAAQDGDGAVVSLLLAAGVDPSASVTGRLPSGEEVHTTALVTAVGNGHLEAARLLLEAGADPSLASSDGVTPLMDAAANGQLEVLRLLLARGAAVDTLDPGDGCTAFHAACANNQADCAEALVKAGCDVSPKDNIDGQTGREMAEVRGHAAVVARLRAVVGEQLRAAQAVGPAPAPEPAAVVGDGGPEVQLVMAAQDGNGAAVARLLAAGVDPNASMAGRLPSGEVVHTTALRAAADRGRLEAVRLLLDAGADPSRAGGDGTTPLMAAAGKGQLEVLRLLLARGAVVDAVNPGIGGTAFHIACFESQAECAEALARAGSDVGLKDSDGSGKTGREVAEARGSKGVVRRLRAIARQPFVGVLVELAGLVGAAEHNGKRATVMSARPSRSHHASAFLGPARILSALCTIIEERYAWQSNGCRADPPPCGARCCATFRRSSATRSSCWSRRPGAAARGSAWTCDQRTFCWRTCRAARGVPGPGGSTGSRRCSLVLFTS